MRKFLFLITSIFVLALIFAPLTRAVPIITPELTVIPTDILSPTMTPEITEEPTVINEIKETKEEEIKLDQKEIIGVILIGILIVIIVIQALWDKFKNPPSAHSSDPE
jgi:hypothetical protein